MNYSFNHLLKSPNKQPARYLGLLMLAMFLSVPVQSSHAQSKEDALLFSQRAPATGARSIGLSGAGRAGLGDYSDFFTNPAGLGWLKTSQISGALNFLSVTNDAQMSIPGSSLFTEELSEQGLGNFAGAFKVPTKQGALVIGGAFNQTNTFERSLFFQGDISAGSISNFLFPALGEFSVIEDNGSFFPVFEATTLGDFQEVAYQAGVIEFLGEFYDPAVGPEDGLFDEAVVLGSNIQVGSDVFQEGRMKEFSFGGAFEAARGVMIGGSLNFSVGTYDFQSIYDEFDVNNENTVDDYIIFDGADELRGFDFLSYEERFTSDLVGANVRFGVSAAANPNLRVGLTIESPTFYRVDENFDTIMTTEFDTGQSLSYGGLTGDVRHGTFEYDITTPWRFGAGLSYNIAGFTLMGDLEFIDWSQLELEANSSSSDLFSSLNREIRNDFTDVINLRLAGEYALNDLSLRAGVGFNPDPNDARFEDGTQLDNDKSFVSLGLGYKFSNQFAVDVGWMQERQDDLYLPNFVDYEVAEELVRNYFVVGLSVLF